jgi:fructose-1,6-bisphosphatase/inositol monophosphatase family enzyme
MTKDPRFLATAIEAVIKAGDIQMSFIDSGFQINRKGTIDLVTEADVAVETMFRRMIGERVWAGSRNPLCISLLGVRSD